MKRFLLFSFLFLFASVRSAEAQQVIINELYNSSGNDEWVELLVVQDSLDMRGWDIRDFNSGGVAQTPLELSSNALWSSLRSGTIIIVARPENGLADDTDPSDYLLVINTNNGLYFSGNPFLFAGASDAVQVRNASDTHVFGISWGTGNAASLPAPKVHFTGTMISGNTVYFNEDSLPELTSTTNWTFNTASQSRGVGNTPTNIAWINTLRGGSSPDGSGTARVSPDTLNGGTTTNISITYSRDPSLTITDMRIIIPSAFNWSRTVGSVSYTNMTATTSVSTDTIYFNNLTLSADSTVVTVQNVTAPESTAFYRFRTQTKGAVQYRDVSPIPTMVVFGSPLPIAEIKTNDTLGVPLRLGDLVTIRGIVTVANEFGGPSYIQDNSGGMAIYGSSLSTAAVIGDEVVVSGVVSPFNGLFEIVSPRLHSILSSGNPLTPLVVTCSQLFNDGVRGVEQFEGSLVRLNVVTVTDTFGSPISTWAVSGSGTNYRLNDATGFVDIRVDNNVNFANMPAPQSQFDVIGVVSQYKTTLPYIGGYQLMPRATYDILSTGPIIATQPAEGNIEQTSIAVGWTTIHPGTSRLRYGRTTSYELGVVAPDDSVRTNHQLTISGLLPATIYNVLAFSVAGSDTSRAANLVVSTSSPSASTGQMNVYFNRSVNTSVSTGEPALGNQDLTSRLSTRINQARRSIDAMIHSLSGTPGDNVASALVLAKLRGVRIRVICEADNRNTNAFNTLVSNGIPLIDDRFDPVNNGVGLMHNKTFVFDYRGGAPESIWVWTGSWNLTAQQTTTDPQNSIEIQDVALAGAYTVEFNEMWGSDTDVPNASNSRFGARKRDNTPHRFVVNGIPVESYFSPSDRTTTFIKNTLRRAEQDVAFVVYSFTRRDIADTLIAVKNRGRRVRGVVDGSAEPEQFAYLVSNGIDVKLDPSGSLMHHKYAIVDGTRGTISPQWVITGSHNWSNNAETSNNENTVIIQWARVANLYLQEFAQRYYESGGIDSIRVSIEEIGGLPSQFSLAQNYPNPFNPSTAIIYELPLKGKVTLTVYNLLGQEVATLVNQEQNAGRYRVDFNAPQLASGVYFYRLATASFTDVKKMMLVR
jgi:phosphatidylserine/phosphatidylglycerophosphate/cardiolipin synthase-like enzyme